ncbi:Eukaryotic/viral aspartic protease [Phytophthora megakarya]|uniref:Eukaryotic/viral aspartic protease n=1 Tax=Phytophthora megakarya TaxID=4795 RepID=A0A225URZ3_9STRA|nr:Eukaryotic/viral aspartic protease [Phytophthora megakarya]
MNGDTPAANKVLGRIYEEMMEKSTWIRLFEPKRIRQAVWADLSHELAVAVTATTTGQVASDTIPLPKTPSKGYNTVPKSHGVFSKPGDETPYFQDSHMITPKSSGRKEQPDHDGGRANATRSTKIELATHRPLGQIRAFSGLRNKSENTMQWLRGFMYEMKGTRASPDEWCMPFQLSLKDGALHWHRQLPKKTKRTWSLLSSSFISDSWKLVAIVDSNEAMPCEGVRHSRTGRDDHRDTDGG